MGMQTLPPNLESLAHSVLGAAIEVHRALGPGYQESVYARALSHELDLRSIAHTCEAPVCVTYKGIDVGEGRMDILVDGQIVLELKCADEHHPAFEAQLIGYLKATGLQLGYVLNFKKPVLKDGIRRIILSA